MNESIILKHTLRPHERQEFARSVTVATKVILPFCRTDLSIGGSWFFAESQNLRRILVDAVEGYDDHGALDRDARVLQLLMRLPSLDPFLLRERLRREGVHVAPVYFGVSDADLAQMLGFVAGEIKRLVDLAFADAAPDLADRLADRLLHAQDEGALGPLRETLRLSAAEHAEGFFAWKGFLYYKWTAHELRETVRRVVDDMSSVAVGGASLRQFNDINTRAARLAKMLRRQVEQVEVALGVYDRAYHDLVAREKAAAFREFLLQAPSMFLTIGELIGVVAHICAYWTFRFGAERIDALSVDEVETLLFEFEQSLGLPALTA